MRWQGRWDENIGLQGKKGRDPRLKSEYGISTVPLAKEREMG